MKNECREYAEMIRNDVNSLYISTHTPHAGRDRNILFCNAV